MPGMLHDVSIAHLHVLGLHNFVVLYVNTPPF